MRVGVARGLGTTLSPQHNDISWAAYTGIGRDPGVSEVKPHPALCPAHVTVVQVVIRVSMNLLRRAETSVSKPENIRCSYNYDFIIIIMIFNNNSSIVELLFFIDLYYYYFSEHNFD